MAADEQRFGAYSSKGDVAPYAMDRGEVAPTLPPVRPPSAGFLVQLFLIPLLIVSIIVGVWLMFHWLAHMGTRPDELVRDLERLGPKGWQNALTLANMLRDRNGGEFRRDEKLADSLAAVLNRKSELADADPQEVKLRIYLCHALGEFEVDTGLPSLLRACEARENAEVRQAAVAAIGILADRIGADRLLDNEQLLVQLEETATARSDQPEQQLALDRLRSASAYTLGVLGDVRSRDLLARLLDDPFPDARYNAATGLARHADPRAVSRLLEMLDAQNPQIVEQEADDDAKKWKRQLVVNTALIAVKEMAQDPRVDLSSLLPSVEKLAGQGLGSQVELAANEVLLLLRKRGAP